MHVDRLGLTFIAAVRRGRRRRVSVEGATQGGVQVLGVGQGEQKFGVRRMLSAAGQS
ncbi:hypothetical protein [Streptomyces phaeolivaceus]|uniref:hypothetical protein n=1 Tax=Streptomyces phaeolivaceus TaxID=2653200 RepID=UPI00186A88AE|nr:hypothetical protein [Streptomyces phaeolivaceus]